MDVDLVTAAREADLLALIGRDTQLARIAGTLGGEWAGPCPFCGGEDRLHVNPRRPGGGKWYCRQCQPRGGDAIDYLRRRNHLTFREAVASLADGRACAGATAFRAAASVKHGPHRIYRNRAWQAAAQRLVERACRKLAQPEGQAGREYLVRRGLAPESWSAWGLGFDQVWHTLRQTELPAITLPWRASGAFQAIQYRYIATGLSKQERFGQRAGGERLVYGLDLLNASQPNLVLVEGELNAISIWQACRARADVLSLGPQGNFLRPAVRQVLAGITLRYPRVVVWMDEPDLAEQAAQELALGECGQAVWSEGGMDANDRLCHGDLSAYLAAHLLHQSRWAHP